MLSAHKTGKFARLNQVAFGFHGAIPAYAADNKIALVFKFIIKRIGVFADNRGNFEVVLFSEIEIALVAARHAHNRAGTVIGKHVIGSPNGHQTIVNGVLCICAQKDAVLFTIGTLSINGRNFFGCSFKLVKCSFILGVSNELSRNVAFRRQHQKRYTKNGIGTRSKHAQLVLAIGKRRTVCTRSKFKIDFGTRRFTNPVFLLGNNVFGPRVKRIQVRKQFIGIRGNFKIPLRKLFLLRNAVAAPATTVNYLLVCKNGIAGIAPIYVGIRTVCKTFFPHFNKHPLTPAIILRVAGIKGARVVV